MRNQHFPKVVLGPPAAAESRLPAAAVGPPCRGEQRGRGRLVWSCFSAGLSLRGCDGAPGTPAAHRLLRLQGARTLGRSREQRAEIGVFPVRGCGSDCGEGNPWARSRESWEG